MTARLLVRRAVWAALLGGAAWAQAESKPADHAGHIMTTEVDLVWKDGPPSLRAGAKMAVLEGNPSAPGAFTMRIKVPAGYKIPASLASRGRARDRDRGHVRHGCRGTVR